MAQQALDDMWEILLEGEPEPRSVPAGTMGWQRYEITSPDTPAARTMHWRWDGKTFDEYGRRVFKLASREATQSEDREHWLHGWPRGDGRETILIGSGLRCVCCGAERGVVGVALPDKYPDGWPPPEPNWPFNPATCPVCTVAADKAEDARVARLRLRAKLPD